MQIDRFQTRTFPSIESIGLERSDHKVRVCIATEEIIGPVRNGGIASTYYHLCKGLAARGHDVHVLFLKGPIVQDKTPEYWQAHFAEFGVTLHYLDVPMRPVWGGAVNWLGRFQAAYAWLRDQSPFDIVHTSEWRGGMLYCLMAKRLGLAFQDSLFVVKTSSPHIWNRHYQMQPIEKHDLVLASYAEQKCVELADMVVGGSAHLITFMDHIGYRLPPANVFVQPNIVDFSNVPVEDRRPPRQPGDLVQTRELVFFGRLEGRKGIELFCNALDILRARGVLPERVSFLGKFGSPLATKGGLPVEAYLEAKTANWPFPVEIVTGRNQPEALSYMCQRDMIAVMPSLIENSTMAVYETLEKRIPFLATAVGGTPELIAEQDHAACLVAPKSQTLAVALERVLTEGQPIAHPSFSNDANLEVWYGFHEHVGRQIADQGRAAALSGLIEGVDPVPAQIEGITFAALVRAAEGLDDLVEALAADRPEAVLLGYKDATLKDPVEAAARRLTEHGLEVAALACTGIAAGDTLHEMMTAIRSDGVVISDDLAVRPRPGFFAAVKTALSHQPDSLVTTLLEGDDGALVLPVGGDVATQFLSSKAFGPEVVALSKARYEALGPFEPYDIEHGLLHEYITRNASAGGSDLLVCPEILLDWRDLAQTHKARARNTIYSYLKSKPLLDGADIGLRKIILASLAQRTGGVQEHVFRDGGRADHEPIWLTPADWQRDGASLRPGQHLAIALEEDRSRLYFYARGQGTRTLRVDGQVLPPQHVETHGAGTPDEITLHAFDIPDSWEIGTSHTVKWALSLPDREPTRFLRVTRLAEQVFAIASRNLVLPHTIVLDHFEIRTRHDELICESDPPDPQDELAMQEPLRGHSEDPTIDELIRLAQDSDLSSDLKVPDQEEAQAQSAELMSRFSDPAHWPCAPGGDVRAAITTPKKTGWQVQEWITGWAWDRKAPGAVLHVMMTRNGIPVFLAPADHRIDHLARRTPGLEHHGFRIPVDPDMLTGPGVFALHVVEGGGVPVRNGCFTSTRAAGSAQLVLTDAQAPPPRRRGWLQALIGHLKGPR